MARRMAPPYVKTIMSFLPEFLGWLVLGSGADTLTRVGLECESHPDRCRSASGIAFPEAFVWFVLPAALQANANAKAKAYAKAPGIRAGTRAVWRRDNAPLRKGWEQWRLEAGAGGGFGKGGKGETGEKARMDTGERA